MVTAKITLCIFLLIFTTAHSLSIIKIDNLNENQLLGKISHILDHGGHPDKKKNQIHVRGNRKYLLDDTFTNRRVVKSIVEHGKDIEIEYGKAIYKPLLRIHKHNTKLKEDNGANKDDLQGTNDSEILLITLLKKKKEFEKTAGEFEKGFQKKKKEFEKGFQKKKKEFENEVQKNKAKLINWANTIWEGLKALKNKPKETKNVSRNTMYSLWRPWGSEDNTNDETSDVGEEINSLLTTNELVEATGDQSADATRYLRSSEIHHGRKKPMKFYKRKARTTKEPMPLAESASFWKYWVMSSPLTHNQCPDGAIKIDKKCINNVDFV